MASSQSVPASSRRPLRLWPGVAAAVLLVIGRYVAPNLTSNNEVAMFAFLVGPALAPVVIVSWAFFSRAPRVERWGAMWLMVAVLAATPPFLHESVATRMMGPMFYLYAIPILILAFVVWAVATRHLADGPRRISLVIVVVLACGGWLLFRIEGITGGGKSQLAWRWAPTPEERLLAQAPVAPGNQADPVPPVEAAPPPDRPASAE